MFKIPTVLNYQLELRSLAEKIEEDLPASTHTFVWEPATGQSIESLTLKSAGPIDEAFRVDIICSDTNNVVLTDARPAILILFDGNVNVNHLNSLNTCFTPLLLVRGYRDDRDVYHSSSEETQKLLQLASKRLSLHIRLYNAPKNAELYAQVKHINHEVVSE